MNKFSLTKLTPEQKKLRKKILQISYEKKYSHLGSCLTVVDAIDAIYASKDKDDIFVLSNGHAGLAWYAVLQKYGFIKNDDTIKKMPIHPERNLNYGIHVSTGSLGHGLPIAVGLALVNKKRTIYCMLSDGECSEGSIWETLAFIKKQKINNIKIIINCNGWSAYDAVEQKSVEKKLHGFGFKIKKLPGHNHDALRKAFTNKQHDTIYCVVTEVSQFSFLQGQDAHYYVMTKIDYTNALEELS